MNRSCLGAIALTLLTAVPLRADPSCLLIHPTVPSGAYFGSAAVVGTPGGVLDRCSEFTAPAPWGLTDANGTPFGTVGFGAPRSSLGFWVGTDTRMAMEFYLDGILQHEVKGVFSSTPGWWEWQGSFDRIDVTGVHILMLYGLGGMIEPDQPKTGDIGTPELYSIVGPVIPEKPQATVPEPATFALLASGLVVLAAAGRSRR